jgi:hypothetical protein
MKKIAAALAALMLSFAFANPAFAFGAIAVDDEQGDDEPGFGLVTGADTAEKAKSGALKMCKKEGNDNCKVVVWFKQCGAYAASKKYYGYGYGASEAVASKKALEMCGNKNCKVKVSESE